MVDADSDLEQDNGDEDILLRLLLNIPSVLKQSSISATIISLDALWTFLQQGGSEPANILRGDPTSLSAARQPQHEATIHLIDSLDATSKKLLLQISKHSSSASAFDLHASASQALVLGVNNDGECSRMTHQAVFVTVCLLLSCLALQKHASVEPSLLQRRPKRWQSLVWETIRLFQVRIHCTLASDDKNCHHQDKECMLSELWIPLWINYILPSANSLENRLLQSQNASRASTSHEPSTAYVSGIVATTALLARLCACCHHGLPIAKKEISVLWRRLQEYLPSCVDHIVWYHPWRQYFETRRRDSNEVFGLQAALSYWTTSLENETEEIDKKESVSWFETQWDDLGLACMALCALEHRCYVWSHSYIWWMWFPQIPVLLNTDNSCEQDGSMLLLRIGYELLDSLLSLVPSSAFPLPNHHRNRWNSPPDDPVGTLQLLSNRIVAWAIETRQKGIYHGPSVVNDGLDGASSFRLMQRLVDKYNRRNQVQIVRQLVRECPHPGLRPKLIDLLRPFVYWDKELVHEVWLFLDEILKDLEQHSFHATSKCPLLKNVEDLVDSAELYSSCLSLIYLWIRITKSTPKIDDLVPRLTHCHVVLQSYLQYQSSRDLERDDERLHQLYILESTMQQIIDHESNDEEQVQT